MFKVLFVCTGNICRSPTAEGVFRHMVEERGLADRIEADAHAQESWVAYNADLADQSLRVTCNSWYLGANVPGKPRVFMPFIGGFPAYIEKCDEVVTNGYEGFKIS